MVVSDDCGSVQTGGSDYDNGNGNRSDGVGATGNDDDVSAINNDGDNSQQQW